MAAFENTVSTGVIKGHIRKASVNKGQDFYFTGVITVPQLITASYHGIAGMMGWRETDTAAQHR